MHTNASTQDHPHLNPTYFATLKSRREAQATNRELSRLEKIMRKPMRRLVVPKQPNRYLPHIGAKEMARHAGRKSLGPNASRILQSISQSAAEIAAQDSMEMRLQMNDRISRVDAIVQDAFDHEPVGSTATWTSSNLEKTGEIVAVVPVGEQPSAELTPKVKDPGGVRDHVSYVVKAQGKHYWPRVSLLKIGNR